MPAPLQPTHHCTIHHSPHLCSSPSPAHAVFDLANLWLEQQPHDAAQEQRAALSALVWRRPLAADFLACMAANLPWAKECVAPSALRPARLPASLDGRFSFTAEVRRGAIVEGLAALARCAGSGTACLLLSWRPGTRPSPLPTPTTLACRTVPPLQFELHDLLELQAAALQAGRPRQQQSPAIYCGGYCWWAVLVANPRHNRYELYASCAAFSLFSEPFRTSLQPAAGEQGAHAGAHPTYALQAVRGASALACPAHRPKPRHFPCPPADVRFSFQGSTSLVDWRQPMPSGWPPCTPTGAAPHSGCPPTAPRSSSRAAAAAAAAAWGAQDSAGSGGGALQLAAAARPDTARGPRPSRQMSRLSVGSGAGGSPAAGALAPLPSSRSLGSGGGPLGSALGAGPRSAAYLSDAESSGALTARGPAEGEGGLVCLSMDQTIAEVRRSCPYSWGASLRVRVNLKLLGGASC